MPGPRLELKPSRAQPIALGFLVALVVIPVVLLAPLAAKLAMLPVAAGYVWLAVRLARRRLILDDDRITWSGFRSRTVRWDEATHYTFWSMDQSYVAAGAAAGGGGVIAAMVVFLLVRGLRRRDKHKNRRFSCGRMTIHGPRGTKLSIDAQMFRDAGLALDRAFEELHGRLRTRERDFTPFTLGEVDLHHATQGSLALADIDKIVVGSSRVAVKRRGKRRAWARARMAKVHNVMLLLEELAERGLIVDTRRDVFVPPPVLGKLEEAASRQAAMPQAKIVRRN
jgi:hypothetical protein